MILTGQVWVTVSFNRSFQNGMLYHDHVLCDLPVGVALLDKLCLTSSLLARTTQSSFHVFITKISVRFGDETKTNTGSKWHCFAMSFCSRAYCLHHYPDLPPNIIWINISMIKNRNIKVEWNFYSTWPQGLSWSTVRPDHKAEVNNMWGL